MPKFKERRPPSDEHQSDFRRKFKMCSGTCSGRRLVMRKKHSFWSTLMSTMPWLPSPMKASRNAQKAFSGTFWRTRQKLHFGDKILRQCASSHDDTCISFVIERLRSTSFAVATRTLSNAIARTKAKTTSLMFRVETLASDTGVCVNAYFIRWTAACFANNPHRTRVSHMKALCSCRSTRCCSLQVHRCEMWMNVKKRCNADEQMANYGSWWFRKSIGSNYAPFHTFIVQFTSLGCFSMNISTRRNSVHPRGSHLPRIIRSCPGRLWKWRLKESSLRHFATRVT